jgi:hypothetical protein
MAIADFELAVTLVALVMTVAIPMGISLAIILTPGRPTLARPSGPPPAPARVPAFAGGNA